MPARNPERSAAESKDPVNISSGLQPDSSTKPVVLATPKLDEGGGEVEGLGTTETVFVPQVVQSAHEGFGGPKNFINRELSWLEFNRRGVRSGPASSASLASRQGKLPLVILAKSRAVRWQRAKLPRQNSLQGRPPARRLARVALPQAKEKFAARPVVSSAHDGRRC